MPVIPLVLRYAVKDVKIGNTLVPRNTLLLPHFLAMHTSHRYWERPLDFIPVSFFFHYIKVLCQHDLMYIHMLEKR